MDANDIANLKFHKNIKEQKKNIISNFSTIKQEVLSASPIAEWYKRKANGDELFTTENLKDSKTAIDIFINDVEIATNNKSISQILKAVKTTVNQFDKLNKKYKSFIETTEREELALYKNDVLKK
jgi:uncharacterized protein YsxB (DUF464 family)